MSGEKRRASTRNARRWRCAPRFTRLIGEPLEPRLPLTLTPQLLADINTAPLSIDPRPKFLTMGPVAYFVGKDSFNPYGVGTQVWRSDGTQAGTYPLTDLNPDGVWPPVLLATAGNNVFFMADDHVHGRELWKTDGTPEGTKLVKDITPGPTGTSTFQTGSNNGVEVEVPTASIGGTLFFVANDGVHGSALWKSDGSESGTVLVKELPPGQVSGRARELTNVNGTLFFAGLNGLWKSDGTPEGTVLLKSLNLSADYSTNRHVNFTGVGGTLFFAARNGSSSLGLYKSDGTPEGTVVVKESNLFTEMTSLTNVNGTLFFTAQEGFTGFDLWKSDGSGPGTVKVKDLPATFTGNGPVQLTVVGQKLFFVYTETTTGRELWSSDGSPEGTGLVKDIWPGGGNPSYPDSLTTVGNLVYFVTRDTLSAPVSVWKSDGTPAGTVRLEGAYGTLDTYGLANWEEYSPLANVNGALFFRAADPLGLDGYQLWRSDGTAAGTVMVPRAGSHTASSVSTSSSQLIVGGTLYFAAANSEAGAELWKTDGTAAGTVLIKDINPGPNSSSPLLLGAYDGNIFFTANDGTNGYELWRTDGTTAGTYLLQDICTGTCSTSFKLPVSQNALPFFTADDGVHGWQSWKTDGTAPGTVLDPDHVAARSSGVTINGTNFFVASDGIHGNELWKSDGTPGSAVMLKDILAGSSSSNPLELTVFNGKVFFSAPSFSSSGTLWMSDGTPEGTVAVQDGSTGTAPSYPTHLQVIGGKLFFLSGNAVWRSDGTAAGTFLIKDTYPLDYYWYYFYPLAAVNGKVVFLAYDGTHGDELWVSDGTVEGTTLLTDIYPGVDSSNALRNTFTLVNGVLVFVANDGAHGSELWRTDGTTEGTSLVKDIWPGSSFSNPDGFAFVNGKLVFAANDGVNGDGLWTTDGTPAGTYKLKDTKGVGNLTLIGDTLFFSAFFGNDLWKTDGTAAGTIQLAQGTFSGFTNFEGKLLVTGGNNTIWTSDGTPAGTVILANLAPASGPSGYRSLSGQLIFSASDDAHSRELWTLIDVNVAPSFTKGADIGLTDHQAAVPQVITQWATAISRGPTDEAAQQLTFLVDNDNHGLFSQQPKIDPDGTLKFTLLPNVEGTATVTVKLEDGGGTANGGADTSGTQTFTIDVTKKHRWHNEMAPYSPINRGGMEVLFENDLHSITSTDVLLIINYLNAGLPTKIPASAPAANGTTRPFYDVDGDDSVTATDALLIINVLNAGQGGPVGGEGEGVFATASSPRPNSQVAMAELIALLALDANELATRRRRG